MIEATQAMDAASREANYEWNMRDAAIRMKEEKARLDARIERMPELRPAGLRASTVVDDPIYTVAAIAGVAATATAVNILNNSDDKPPSITQTQVKQFYELVTNNKSHVNAADMKKVISSYQEIQGEINLHYKSTPNENRMNELVAANFINKTSVNGVMSDAKVHAFAQELRHYHHNLNEFVSEVEITFVK